MNDPPRLLEDSAEELSDSVRRLLLVGTQAAPPSELNAQVWAGLSAKLPALGSTVGSPQGASGAGLQGAHVGGLLLKAALAVVTIGALVFGVRALLVREQPAPVALKPALIAQAPPVAQVSAAPAAVVPADLPAAVPSGLPTHATNAVHSGKLTARTPLVASAQPTEPSDASEESRMVAAARDALRAGNSAGALSLLSQAQQRFGGGVLGQEREALTIEALSKSGQRAAAQARGQAFLKNYANSPYSARIRSIVGAN